MVKLLRRTIRRPVNHGRRHKGLPADTKISKTAGCILPLAVAQAVDNFMTLRSLDLENYDFCEDDGDMIFRSLRFLMQLQSHVKASCNRQSPIAKLKSYIYEKFKLDKVVHPAHKSIQKQTKHLLPTEIQGNFNQGLPESTNIGDLRNEGKAADSSEKYCAILPSHSKITSSYLCDSKAIATLADINQMASEARVVDSELTTYYENSSLADILLGSTTGPTSVVNSADTLFRSPIIRLDIGDLISPAMFNRAIESYTMSDDGMSANSSLLTFNTPPLTGHKSKDMRKQRNYIFD